MIIIVRWFLGSVFETWEIPHFRGGLVPETLLLFSIFMVLKCGSVDFGLLAIGLFCPGCLPSRLS